MLVLEEPSLYAFYIFLAVIFEPLIDSESGGFDLKLVDRLAYFPFANTQFLGDEIKRLESFSFWHVKPQLLFLEGEAPRRCVHTLKRACGSCRCGRAV